MNILKAYKEYNYSSINQLYSTSFAYFLKFDPSYIMNKNKFSMVD